MKGLADWASEQAYGTRPAHSIEQIEPDGHNARPRRSWERLTGYLLGASAALVYLAVGLVLGLRYGLVPVDAQSRVANAFFTIAGRTPHLASIGFVWNPLPSVLEIPFVAMRALWPPLVQAGIAAVIVSAACGGIAVLYMHKTLVLLGLQRSWGVLVTLIFALNPLIVYYAANGMSDIMLLSAMLGAGYCAMVYAVNRSVRAIVGAGLWLALGFGYRYEAAIYAVMLALVLVPLTVIGPRGSRSKGASVLALLGVPITYVGGLWLLANWVIMGSPLYFLNSSYSNLASTSTGAYATPYLSAAYHDPVLALWFVTIHVIMYPPLILGLLAVGWWIAQGKSTPFMWILLAAGAAEPLVQGVAVLLGASAGWERFFIFNVPLGILLGAVALVRARGRWRAAVVVVLALGNVGTLVASNSAVLGHGANQVIPQIASGAHVQMSVASGQINSYLAGHPHMVVLVDSFLGWAIVVQSSHPTQFVTSNDPQFKQAVADPQSYVNAILVPEPRPHNVTMLDAVNRRYPSLWSGRLPWTHLLATFSGPKHWRLYAIVTPPSHNGKTG